MSRGVSNQLPCWRRVSLGPEIALTRPQLAVLVLEHYPDEKSEAVEHLGFPTPSVTQPEAKVVGSNPTPATKRFQGEQRCFPSFV